MKKHDKKTDHTLKQYAAMVQRSKLLRSRDEWKSKAIKRAYEVREHRKTQKRHQEKIAELKAQLQAMEQTKADKKNAASKLFARH